MRNKFINTLVLVTIIVHIGCTTRNQSKVYYISSGGDDDNTGLTKNTPWKTLTRINRETFQPGDAILLESCGVWNGQLRPLGSGGRGKRSTISCYSNGFHAFGKVALVAGFHSLCVLYFQDAWRHRLISAFVIETQPIS